MTITNNVTVLVICDGKNCKNTVSCQLLGDIDDTYFLLEQDVAIQLVSEHKWVIDSNKNKQYCQECAKKSH